LLLANTLITTSFEPFFWTLAVYAVVRIVRTDAVAARRWWIVLGITIALGAYAKYSILLPVAGVAIGLLATAERRVFRSPSVFFAIAVAALLISPNILWQFAHGWPIVEVLGENAAHRPEFQNGLGLEFRDLAENARAFALEQLVYTNPLAVPVWLAGAIAPFRVASLRDLRFAGVGYGVVFLIAVAFSAKGYYIVGFYAALFAIGAVAIERARVYLRTALIAALVAVGVASMPLSLPVLPIDGLIAYSQVLGLTGRNGTPARLIQPVFAEEFGWNRLARDVASVYVSLPPAVRVRAAIYADTYGDAGALDFFGPRYGLPAAISSQNNYYLWGTHGYDGSVLVAIGATRIDLLRRFYRSVTLVRTSTEPYKWIVEGPAPIYLCRDPVAPLDRIWPYLRWYGA
jgi:hypothetical protein